LAPDGGVQDAPAKPPGTCHYRNGAGYWSSGRPDQGHREEEEGVDPGYQHDQVSMLKISSDAVAK